MKSKTRLLERINFDRNRLLKELEIISNFPVFEEEYSEFSSGTWINNSLWNDDGNYKNTQYKNYSGPAQLTELGEKTHYINNFIEKYFDIKNLKMVRTRNLVNGQVLPHKDFIELDDDEEKYIRVLIPLETSLTSYHSDEYYGVFRMLKGDIWMLDASVIHAAYNFSEDSRVILCLDFQYHNFCDIDENIIFKKHSIRNKNIEPMIFNRAKLREQDIEDFISYISKSINTVSDVKKAVIKISSAHVHHEIPIGKIYDILIEAAKKKGKEIEQLCKKMKRYYILDRSLGERFIKI